MFPFIYETIFIGNLDLSIDFYQFIIINKIIFLIDDIKVNIIYKIKLKLKKFIIVNIIIFIFKFILISLLFYNILFLLLYLLFMILFLFLFVDNLSLIHI